MIFSAEQLLSIAREYWPADQESYVRPDKSPQAARLQKRWKEELEKVDPWRAFLRDLTGELPGFTIGDATTTFDACLRCAAYPERESTPPHVDWAVVGCISILAPVYTVYGVQYEYSGKERISHRVFLEPLPPEMRGPATTIARKIESTFGASLLPREVGEVPIPLFVDPQQPPNTTLFHALFVSQPERVP
ncbi:MAG: hypothetical protein ACJ8AT_00805 [Hyalangium sp.]|uniref:hypothetical protein n=1 Tax=Hyalangium sp. TaxID=2028555 RepID=UPI00389AE849